MAKKKNWYYGFSRLIRIIIAIVPILSLIVHLLARLDAGKGLLHLVLVVVVCLVFGWNILWIVDIITTLVTDRILLT